MIVQVAGVPGVRGPTAPRAAGPEPGPGSGSATRTTTARSGSGSK